MIITLIGSKRFEPWFSIWQEVLTLHNHTIHIMSIKSDMINENKLKWLNDTISISDAIMVLNKFAYTGEDTMDELKYAIELNKTIIALESWGNGNGIDSKHFKEVQDSAKQYDVYGIMSPIDTYKFMHPYHTDILGPAGELRNKAIQIIKEKEIIALGYDSNNLKHYWQK